MDLRPLAHPHDLDIDEIVRQLSRGKVKATMYPSSHPAYREGGGIDEKRAKKVTSVLMRVKDIADWAFGCQTWKQALLRSRKAGRYPGALPTKMSIHLAFILGAMAGSGDALNHKNATVHYCFTSKMEKYLVASHLQILVPHLGLAVGAIDHSFWAGFGPLEGPIDKGNVNLAGVIEPPSRRVYGKPPPLFPPNAPTAGPSGFDLAAGSPYSQYGPDRAPSPSKSRQQGRQDQPGRRRSDSPDYSMQRPGSRARQSHPSERGSSQQSSSKIAFSQLPINRPRRRAGVNYPPPLGAFIASDGAAQAKDSQPKQQPSLPTQDKNNEEDEDDEDDEDNEDNEDDEDDENLLPPPSPTAQLEDGQVGDAHVTQQPSVRQPLPFMHDSTGYAPDLSLHQPLAPPNRQLRLSPAAPVFTPGLLNISLPPTAFNLEAPFTTRGHPHPPGLPLLSPGFFQSEGYLLPQHMQSFGPSPSPQPFQQQPQFSQHPNPAATASQVPVAEMQMGQPLPPSPAPASGNQTGQPLPPPAVQEPLAPAGLSAEVRQSLRQIRDHAAASRPEADEIANMFMTGTGIYPPHLASVINRQDHIIAQVNRLLEILGGTNEEEE